MKKLKQFSYYIDYGKDRGTQYYIMASSQKQVVEMLNSIGRYVTINDVKHYFYKAWGNNGVEIMKDIEITEPSVYVVKLEGMFGKMVGTPTKMV
jgi:hypothetical protein